MNDEKLAVILFDVGFVLALVSMVIGPFGIVNWAITLAGIACCLALGAMVIGFEGWDVPPPEQQPEQEPFQEQEAQVEDMQDRQ